ncbi:MAG: VWA domain-containing protein [Candidatus Cloacimonetes bacterium]|nr:VWA domain-containing protein [Candidatus Cloacimonadota bacterium]
MMRWGNPYVLILLLLIPVLLVLVGFTGYYRRKRFTNFAETRFFQFFMQEFSAFHWNLRNVILIGSLFFVIIAVARPQWGKEMLTVKKEGLDIVVCIDVSKSMDAEDIQPSRLERAKDQISLFIDQLKGDRIGIVSFAGRSFVQSPLTDDYGAAKLFLHLLDTESLSAYGTDIGGALVKGSKMFAEKDKYKVMILISDGEDLEAGAIKAAEEIAKSGVLIYTLGVGSPEGSTIPIRKPGGGMEYAKDNQGNIVLTKLDVATLSRIAAIGGGRFYPVTPHQAEIFEILTNINQLEKKKFDSREFVRYKEQYHYFLLLALLLLLAESAINVSKKVKFQRVLSSGERKD